MEFMKCVSTPDGQSVMLPMTAAEIKVMQADKLRIEAIFAETEAKAEAAAAAKTALLARLGITADEAKLLLG
jgi:hypothetical protein